MSLAMGEEERSQGGVENQGTLLRYQEQRNRATRQQSNKRFTNGVDEDEL